MHLNFCVIRMVHHLVRMIHLGHANTFSIPSCHIGRLCQRPKASTYNTSLYLQTFIIMLADKRTYYAFLIVIAAV